MVQPKSLKSLTWLADSSRQKILSTHRLPWFHLSEGLTLPAMVWRVPTGTLNQRNPLCPAQLKPNRTTLFRIWLFFYHAVAYADAINTVITNVLTTCSPLHVKLPFPEYTYKKDKQKAVLTESTVVHQLHLLFIDQRRRTNNPCENYHSLAFALVIYQWTCWEAERK